ncbi:MAG: hypothetical protein WKF35_01990 [Ferruginibacter sp.]
MRYTKKIVLITLLLAGAFATLSAQRIINVAAPVVGNVPVAIMAHDKYMSAGLQIRRNGTLAIATTHSELKVWTLPEGVLIYRFQSPAEADPSRRVMMEGETKLYFTGDEKYMYPYTKTEVVESQSGELLQAGALRDSILNGSYNVRRGYIESIFKLSAELHNKLSNVGTSPLALKRDYSGAASDERIELIAVQKDPFDKNVMHIIYNQTHCGTKDWIKNTLKKDVNHVREWQKKRGYCGYYDNCWATYNLVTGQAVVLGRFTDDALTGEQAYGRVESATISPFGDVALVKFAGRSAAIFAPGGRLLWNAPEKVSVIFDHFDGVGNMVIKQDPLTSTEKSSISVHSAATGEVVTRYQIPGTHSNTKMGLVEQMELVSHISATPDGNFAITLHQPETGKLMLSLTDDEATKAFAKQYKADAEFFAIQNAERKAAAQRSQQEAYNQSVADHNRAYNRDVAARSGGQNAADPNACKPCGGSGWVMTKGFMYNKTTREYSSGAGSSSTNYRVTSTPVYSNYESRAICSACGGKGKSRR